MIAQNIKINNGALVRTMSCLCILVMGKLEPKKILVISLLVIFVFCASLTIVTAQDVSTIMFNVYAQSVLYPESFDAYVQENQHLFNQRFLTCLNRLLITYSQIAKQHSDYCNQFADSRMRSDCIQRNSAATIGMWCLSIQERLNGTPWVRTFSGDLAYGGKQLTDALLGAGTYLSLTQQFLPMVRGFFRCE